MKAQDKTLEKELNKIEIRNLPYKEFKIAIIKKLNKLGERMHEYKVTILTGVRIYEEESNRAE